MKVKEVKSEEYLRLIMNMQNKILELKLHYENDIYQPLAVVEKDDIVLIDTGMPEHFEQLKNQLGLCKIAVKEISKIIITHAHIDHIGTIIQIKEENVDVEIWIHEADVQALYDGLPTSDEGVKNSVMEAVKTFKDQDVLPHLGGLEVIHTPGHTPGHVCLYSKAEKILVAGDELNVVNGELVGPDIYYTPDMPLAMSSMKRLMELEIDQVYCFHGGKYAKAPMLKIKKIIE